MSELLAAWQLLEGSVQVGGLLVVVYGLWRIERRLLIVEMFIKQQLEGCKHG